MSGMRVEPGRRIGGRRGGRAGATLVRLTAALALTLALASGCGADDEARRVGRAGRSRPRARAERGGVAPREHVHLRRRLHAGEGERAGRRPRIRDLERRSRSPRGRRPRRARSREHLPGRVAIRSTDPSSSAGRATRSPSRCSVDPTFPRGGPAGRSRADRRATRTRSSPSTTFSRSRCDRACSTATAAPRTTPSPTTRRPPAARHPGRAERRVRAGALRAKARAGGVDRGRRPAAPAELRDPPEGGRGSTSHPPARSGHLRAPRLRRRVRAERLSGATIRGAGRVTASSRSRKVRTPKGRTLGKPQAAKADGKWNRKQTACGASPEAPQVRVKRWGKSPPASWRHGGSSNPVRCKVKQIPLTRPAEGSGTPLEPSGNRRPRGMVTLDRIRLTGLLTENPGFAGFSY